MSTVTTLLNLVKPTTAEQFSLATLNNNMDIIDGRFATVEGKFKKLASGSSSLSITTTQTSLTEVITLPAGFTSTPQVFLQYNTNAAGRALLLRLDAYGITTGQFTVKMSTTDGAQIGSSYTISYSWLAVSI